MSIEAVGIPSSRNDCLTFTFGQSSKKQLRAVIAATIGNALEWFDIIIFGFFAILISKNFFPAKDELTSLLMTTATFGVAYVARPIGAVVLGLYADRAGRKKALTRSMMLMTFGTLLIACSPNYASIGWLAPVLIVIARIIQGFSAGGEFGSSTAFLLEHAAKNKRGFYGSWQVASQGATAFLAALFGFLISYLPEIDQLSWGWRIPFLFGGLIGPIGFYIRSATEESPLFLSEVANKKLAHSKSRESTRPMHEGLAQILLAGGLIVLATVGSYFLLVYMPTYAIRQLHLAPSLAFFSVMAAGAVQLCLSPWFGALSDRIGTPHIMIPGALVVGIGMYPALIYIGAAPSVSRIILMQVILGTGLTAYFAPVPAIMGRLFVTGNRTTGLSVSYSLAVTIFGGFAPFIITTLIHRTADPVSPAYYVAFGAIISLLSLRHCSNKLK
jgi:MHS family proline/betaine transporter-like MFS transporter